MGSYINQCFASKQIVMEGERCRVVPLIKQRAYHETTCLSQKQENHCPTGEHPGPFRLLMQKLYGEGTSPGVDGKWKPLMGFIEAVANDRVSTDLVFNENTNEQLFYFLQSLATQSAVSTVFDNQDDNFNFVSLAEQFAPSMRVNNTPGQISEKEIQLLWNELAEPLANQSIVYMSDYAGVFCPVSLGVIHETAYQWLLNYAASTLPTDYINKLVDSAYAHTTKLMARIGETYEKELTSDDVKLYESLHLHDAIRDGLRRISDQVYGRSDAWIGKLTECISQHQITGDNLPVLIKIKMKSFIEDSLVMRGLDLCGIRFEPMVYAGQDYDNEAGSRYASLVTFTNEAVNRKRATELLE